MLKGIDVSSWQKGINLSVVPADFVIIKATQGTWYVSPECDKQYQEAKKSGKLLGVYHYAEGSNPIAEADYFINNIKGYIREAILCLDWEGQDNPRFGNNDKAWVKEFCDHVFAKTGVKPLVYVQSSAMDRLNGIGDYGLWVAQYPNYEPTGYQDAPWNECAYSCAIRQYASTGRLSGYNGNLDLNKFYGDRKAWLKYANPINNSKSIELLAEEVLANKWGTGKDRENRLKAEGYDYAKVQNRVNEYIEKSEKILDESKKQLKKEGFNSKVIFELIKDKL